MRYQIRERKNQKQTETKKTKNLKCLGLKAKHRPVQVELSEIVEYLNHPSKFKEAWEIASGRDWRWKMFCNVYLIRWDWEALEFLEMFVFCTQT